LVLALMATPILGSQAAEIQLLKSINLYNTMWGMYILKFNFLGLYYLIFYEAFKTLPNDFLESAYIDGASEMRVLISIALPMVKTLIGTVFILKFIAFWNDYETIIMYLKSYPTLANGIYNLGIESQGSGAVVPMKMAGCMFLVIPIVVIFLIFSKRLMGNLSMGGLKE
jgi:ABC-type glycerol-3-phosphate transport system permease component